MNTDGLGCLAVQRKRIIHAATVVEIPLKMGEGSVVIRPLRSAMFVVMAGIFAEATNCLLGRTLVSLYLMIFAIIVVTGVIGSGALPGTVSMGTKLVRIG